MMCAALELDSFRAGIAHGVTGCRLVTQKKMNPSFEERRGVPIFHDSKEKCLG